MSEVHRRPKLSLEQIQDRYDIVVIGGGITGAGILREASSRGLSALLVEREDLAYGTSSRSSKLVHGGLRYLEQFEFALVFEALRERHALAKMAPHLVTPLPFLFPVFKDSRRKLIEMRAGMWLYDTLSLFRSPSRHKIHSAAQLKTEEPILTDEQLVGAPLYYDYATDDARLTLETALDAVDRGAHLLTGVEAIRFVQDPNRDHTNPRIEAVVLRDTKTGKTREVRAHAFIAATGPWTDETRQRRSPKAHRMLRPTKGVHFVVEHEKLPLNHAVVLFHPKDGRVLFALPWGTHSYVGTTDTDHQGSLDDLHATRDDIDYLLEATQEYFPSCPLAADDIVSTWAGLRPLIDPQREGQQISESSVSREHEVWIESETLVSIAGGKLTTYREMAKDAVDKAMDVVLAHPKEHDPLPTFSVDAPLPGGRNYPASTNDLISALQSEFANIETDIVAHLANTYGTVASSLLKRASEDSWLAARLERNRPEIWGQIEHAIDAEWASSVTDVLLRRTQVFYRSPSQGLDFAEKVGAFMAERLKWSDEEREQSIANYRKEVELSRRFRTQS